MAGMISMGIGMHRQGGVRWADETTSLLGRMSVAPNGARALLINDLVNALKLGGIWPRLDAFYMLAAHDPQAARCNWIAGLYDLSVVGMPVFEADQGYTGNGTSYLDTGFNPVVAGMFALTDAHIGVYCRSNAAEDVGDCGNVNTRIFTRTTGNRISGRMNDTAAPSVLANTSSSMGHTVFSRASNDSYRVDKNGEIAATAVNVATGLTGANFLVLGAGSSFSTKLVAAVHFGRSLTPVQSTALASAVQVYLDGAGT